MAVVYRHRRNDTNEIFYIGIGIDAGRAYNYSARSKYWKHIYNKVGRTVEILASDIDYESAKELEMFLIQEYGRADLGLGNLVNMTDGGDGTIGKVLTNQVRKKIGDGNRGTIHSVKSRNNMSKAHIGQTPWNKDIPMSEEQKIKLRGKVRTEEHKAKLSAALMGRIVWNIKEVYQYDLYNNFIDKYNSVAEARRITKVCKIDVVCRGERKTAGGYIWSYTKLNNNQENK